MILSIILLTTSLLVLFEADYLKSRTPTVSFLESKRGLNRTRNTVDSSAKVKRLPQAIIVGTRKSGTRALLKFLEVNPAIRSASNEVHFFDRPQNYKKGLDWYRNQMPETSINEITIEKSPAYFVTKSVPERVRDMNADVKLIVIFRNPVTRLISDYSQLTANRLRAMSLDQRYDSGKNNDPYAKLGLTDDNLWQEAGREFEEHVLRPDGGIDERRQIVKTGMYSIYLEKWMALFPRNQMHFVDGERLITEPDIELQKLEQFLGVKASIKREHFVFSSEKGFFCLSGRNSTQLSPSPLSQSFELGQTFNMSIKPICLSESKGRRHITVRKEVEKKLQYFYAPYNEYLQSLTNITFII